MPVKKKREIEDGEESIDIEKRKKEKKSPLFLSDFTRRRGNVLAYWSVGV